MRMTRTSKHNHFDPETARAAHIERAGEPYASAFEALDEADQERIRNSVARLTYFVHNMGEQSACELLAKLGQYLNSGGVRAETRTRVRKAARHE